MNDKPVRGDLAVCSRGALGLITESQPQRVLYKKCDYCIGAISGADAPELCECETGMAYVGIHLTDKIAAIGSPWCSRTPVIIGKLRTATLRGYANTPPAVFSQAMRTFSEIVAWENRK